jgi:predicted ArsR family transcriptional regulator
VLEVLQSDTARAVLAEVGDRRGTTSDVADRVDTSLQNAHYHLERLADVGLVEVVGTHYSSRGREMDVYARANDPLVLVGGDGGHGADPGDRPGAGD